LPKLLTPTAPPKKIEGGKKKKTFFFSTIGLITNNVFNSPGYP
jgi:hypothetical protein